MFGFEHYVKIEGPLMHARYFQGSVLSRLDRDSRLGRMALLGGCHVAGHVADGARAGFCCGLGPSDMRVGPFGHSAIPGSNEFFSNSRNRTHPLLGGCIVEGSERFGNQLSECIQHGATATTDLNFQIFPGCFMLGFEHYVKIEGPLMHDIFLGSVRSRLDRDSRLWPLALLGGCHLTRHLNSREQLAPFPVAAFATILFEFKKLHPPTHPPIHPSIHTHPPPPLGDMDLHGRRFNSHRR